MTFIANVALTNTFDEWRTTTNQIVSRVNGIPLGNTINVVSNTAAIVVSQSVTLGNTLYISANVTSSTTDTATNNIASARAVSNVNIVAYSAYDKANSTNLYVFSVDANTNAAFRAANTAYTHANNAYNYANAVGVIANAAFNAANNAVTDFSPAFNQANAAIVLAGVAFNQSNTAYNQGNAAIALAGVAFNQGNTAYNQANAAYNAANAASITVIDDSSNATRFIAFTSNTSGSASSLNVSNSGLTFNPSTGTLSATIFNSLSDETLKTDVVSITNSLDVIRQLDGVSFSWKNNGRKSYGVIAQEIEKILPDLVDNANGIKNVNYSGIIAFLIQSIKELEAKINEIKK